MKEKLKSMVAAVLAVCICICMAGCGESSKNPDSNNEQANAVTSSGGQSETAAEETAADEDDNDPDDSSISFQPLPEILEADISSGLVQINDEIFKNGGYMTVKEFVDKYGDKYDVSDIDLDKEAEKGFYFRYSVKYPELNMELYLECREPVSGTGTAADAVIINFYADSINRFEPSVYDIWYPTGISRTTPESRLDEFIDFFEQRDFEKEDTIPYDGMYYGSIPEKAPLEYINKYFTDLTILKNGTETESLAAVIEMDEPNLYGTVPVTVFGYICNDASFARYFTFYYKDKSLVKLY